MEPAYYSNALQVSDWLVNDKDVQCIISVLTVFSDSTLSMTVKMIRGTRYSKEWNLHFQSFKHDFNFWTALSLSINTCI